MKVLEHGQQIKVNPEPYGDNKFNPYKYEPEIVVSTQKGFFDEDPKFNEKYGRTYEEDTNQDYAWANRSASVLTADYPGKAEAHAAKRKRYADAVEIEDGEIVQIDGRQFKARVIGRVVSDPIHFTEIK